MTRACLVSGPAADLDGEDTDRLRDAGLVVFWVVGRAEAFGLDLGLVMGSSELMRRYPPHHPSPAWVNHPAGPDPEAGLSRPKSPQQRSVQARMLLALRYVCRASPSTDPCRPSCPFERRSSTRNNDERRRSSRCRSAASFLRCRSRIRRDRSAGSAPSLPGARRPSGCGREAGVGPVQTGEAR
jgi:hypothetical protein